MTDMTDQAIDWVRAVKSLAPDKLFFLYFAPGAVHAPHHVPKEGADVGEDLATPVTEDYQVPAKFSGTIRKIMIEVQPILAADRSAVDLTDIEGLERRAEFE